MATTSASGLGTGSKCFADIYIRKHSNWGKNVRGNVFFKPNASRTTS